MLMLPEKIQIAINMGIPAEVTADGVQPVHPSGQRSESDKAAQGCLKIDDRSHHKTAVATGVNIARPTIIRGHHRQATGRGLQQGESERFRQCRIDKNTSVISSPAVERWNLITPMPFWERHRSIQVVAVDKLEELLKHPSLLRFLPLRIITTAEDEHQIVCLFC